MSEQIKSLRRVVVTGVGVASPAGFDVQDTYTAVWDGRPCFTPITRFDTSGSSVRFAGNCPEPDQKRLPDRKVQKILRRKDVISLLTCLATRDHAALAKDQVNPERFGMYVGAGSTQIGDLTPYFTLVAECADMEHGSFDSARFGHELMRLVNPLVVLQTLMNNALCFGAMTLDIRGVNANFMDFQAAGLRAVGEGFQAIAYDRADIVLAGGVAGPVEPFQLAEGLHSGYLARTSDMGSAGVNDVVMPYDQARSGAILSEGSAFVMLEEETHARKRGAPILACIEGFGLATDGLFDFMSETASSGLMRAMAVAKADPSDLGFVMGHGNGSLHADRAEARAYAEHLGARAKDIPVCSPKAIIGDMCEASGVVGLVLAIEAIRRQDVPPTFNFRAGDEDSRRLSIKAQSQKIRVPKALVTSRNFLGLCAALKVTAP